MADLPQLSRFFLTDGGLETDLLFNHDIDLPHFSSSTLFDTPEKFAALAAYYLPYLKTAREHRAGFILESPTWRGSCDWAIPLDMSVDELETRNRDAIKLMKSLRERDDNDAIVVSGQIGPRGDGYDPGSAMSVEEARDYHAWQVASSPKKAST
ncbi:homocysteine S-methyltransferase family protein [Sphingomicrobium sp. B8]|uniref:Homocysteine S-methyltransferase family protein n=1 Tax=Sphingomicrobium clamense TaxID=2851013 RepID=A0ABS6V6B3_9SPHN|nr:homocysteine S-methyltransferase family protein [Sphingomicrobium sp. B8]